MLLPDMFLLLESFLDAVGAFSWEVEKREIVGLRIVVIVTTTYFIDLQVNIKDQR